MADQGRPLNILLIMTDQQRWDTLGCYGAPICRTPHVDALAARGVRFDAAYAPTSPCSPARAALFTGLYPHKNHVLENGFVLNPEAPNLASELGQAGYNLGYAGKWHVDNPKVPTDYGFQGHDFGGYGYPIGRGLVKGLRFGLGDRKSAMHYELYLKQHGYEPPRVLESTFGHNPGMQGQEMYALQSGSVEATFEYMVSEFAIDLLRQQGAAYRREGKPFFLWTNFWGPHTPCLLPEPYYSMYDPRAIPEDPAYRETWENKPDVHDLYARYFGLDRWDWRQWQELVARYWGYVTMLDDLTGRILAQLRALDLEKDTLVVFTTDHGDQMGAHRMVEKGPYAYEESWRLPMVAAHPACQAPGSVCSEFVYLHDLFPTFLEVAGQPMPKEPDSQSILANILGQDIPTGRDSVYGAFAGHLFPAPLRFVRTATHKLVYNRTQIGELYDLCADPQELHNLIDAPEAAAVKEDLLQRMHDHMVRLGDPILPSFERMRGVY